MIFCIGNQSLNSTKARYTTTNTVRDSELDLAMFGKIVLNALFSGESNKFRVCFKSSQFALVACSIRHAECTDVHGRLPEHDSEAPSRPAEAREVTKTREERSAGRTRHHFTD